MKQVSAPHRRTWRRLGTLTGLFLVVVFLALHSHGLTWSVVRNIGHPLPHERPSGRDTAEDWEQVDADMADWVAAVEGHNLVASESGGMFMGSQHEKEEGKGATSSIATTVHKEATQQGGGDASGSAPFEIGGGEASTANPVAAAIAQAAGQALRGAKPQAGAVQQVLLQQHAERAQQAQQQGAGVKASGRADAGAAEKEAASHAAGASASSKSSNTPATLTAVATTAAGAATSATGAVPGAVTAAADAAAAAAGSGSLNATELVLAPATPHGRVLKSGLLDLRVWHPSHVANRRQAFEDWLEASVPQHQKAWSGGGDFPLPGATGAQPAAPMTASGCMIFVNHLYKFIFLRHAKTASTSLLDFFGKCGDGTSYNSTCLQRYEVGATSLEELHKMWSEYFVWTFVRNPWDRAVSSYLMMMRQLEWEDIPAGEESAAGTAAAAGAQAGSAAGISQAGAAGRQVGLDGTIRRQRLRRLLEESGKGAAVGASQASAAKPSDTTAAAAAAGAELPANAAAGAGQQPQLQASVGQGPQQPQQQVAGAAAAAAATGAATAKQPAAATAKPAAAAAAAAIPAAKPASAAAASAAVAVASTAQQQPAQQGAAQQAQSQGPILHRYASAPARSYSWDHFCRDPASFYAICESDKICKGKAREFIALHVQPQLPCIAAAEPGGWAVDYIGRVEHIDEDLNEVLEILDARRGEGVPALGRLKEPLANVNGRRCIRRAANTMLIPTAPENYCDRENYYQEPHAKCVDFVRSYYAGDAGALWKGH